MKNEGFTLIELLAVIVILAIIALIATPIVLNIIKDSKNSSIERSAELYLDQVKNEIARYNMIHPGSNFNPSECIVQSDDTLNCDGTSLTVEISGDKPEVGSTIILSEGKVFRTRNFKIGSKNLTYEDGKIKEGTDKPICKAVTTSTTGNIPTGSFNYGDEYICDVGDGENKTFFVLETNGDNASLIMDKNIDSNGKGTTSGNTVAWASKEDYIAAGGTEAQYNSNGNEKGPLTALKYLKSSTKSWTKIMSSQISLPSASQIATAGGDSAWTGSYTGTILPAWLCENLGSTPDGYWTLTPLAANSSYAWYVHDSGHYGGIDVDYARGNGIRPVITISKFMIK